jgi:hypothetical protein
MVVYGSGAGEVDLGVWMAEIAPSLSDTETFNTSQPTSANRPKTLVRKFMFSASYFVCMVEETGGLGPEIEILIYWLKLFK